MTGQVKALSLAGPFSERLRDAMRTRKLGADKLGEASGVAPRLIRKYLAGTVEPRDPWGDPTDNAHSLAAVLDVPVEQLVPVRQAAA